MAFFLSTLLPVAGPSGVATQAHAAQVISRVIVEGNQRVEVDTVLSYMQVSAGQSFDALKIDESVKALFQTGLFSDVQIVRRGNDLVVRVVENPMINRVNFEGNSQIKDSDLAKEVELKERTMFTRSKVQSDVNRIIALYRRSGYYSVKVAPQIIRQPENRVDLVFAITEGVETTVTSINFIGNTAFGESDLKGVIGTAEHSWWKFFQRNDTYDADRVEYDKELLRRYYLKNGFADVRVPAADARLTPDGQNFIITYTIEEGPRYKVADVAVNTGNVSLDPSGLKSGVKTGVGDPYDASLVDKTVENLTLEASRQGFVFAKVDPQIDRNPGQSTLNITYNISEGPRTYIERIDIVGNIRTEDQVIRRELKLFEGDAFNRVLIDRARRRLTALDFFDKIDFREDPGSAPDKIVLVVAVQEKTTGSISFSVGYSTTEAVIGSVSLEERNFLGKGDDLRLNTSLSFVRQQVDFSFTDPYFLGLPISAGVDAFAIATDNTRTSGYKSKQVGGALRTGFELDEYSSVNFRYGLAWRRIDGVDASRAAPAVIASGGSSVKSSISAAYIWDNLDSPVKPTNGFRGELDGEIAGLGGSVRLASVEGHGWYFVPVYEDSVVLKFEGNAGHLQPLGGNNISVQDLFYKGGDTFRGFALSGVGPHQIGNDGNRYSIGGTNYAIGTIEMSFPLGLPEEWGIGGAVFSDFGTVFGSPYKSVAKGTGKCGATAPKDCTVFDTMAFRASVGAGIVWQSPFGPLRFDFSYPLMKAKYDDTEWFRFSVGTRF
ncbi:MAG: outer membrane protein assembly factor BamA [Rhizobiales bacterium]|nr:outer membrane protein assembly factor BamA [Hyphomicrobiales bacterium]MBI3672838.1 outer membrane protein assembly factor BamA [Hyphomicrobiales bacterium]